MSRTPDLMPTLTHCYDATVDIGERRDLGASALGHRWMIDILGGTVDGPRLRGKVLPGGADRQLWRPDGVRELDALYEIQAEDGAIITVRNQVLIQDPAADGSQGRYARSTLRFQAPDGPHGWLNRRVFIGTLQPLRPAREAVRIGVYLVD